MEPGSSRATDFARWFLAPGTIDLSSQCSSSSQITTALITESGLNRPNEKLTVKIEAVRDGYTSWQSQEIAIPECRGYGMFYGATYGE